MTDQSAISALVKRFLASAEDRITGMGEVLNGLATASDRVDRIKRLGRDLHTLKGESRMLGLPEFERIAHAAEDMLFSHAKADRISDETEQLLFEAIDTIFACVQSRLADEKAPKSGIERIIGRLGNAVLGEDDEPKSAPAEPGAVAGEEDDSDSQIDTAAPTMVGKQIVHIGSELLDRMTDLVSNVSGGLVRNRQYLGRLVDVTEELGEWVQKIKASNGRGAHKPADADSDDGNGDGNFASADASVAELTDLLREFRENDFRLALTYSELSDRVREARLQPLRSILVQYPPFVRSAAREVGKRIRVELVDSDLMVDQRVLEELSEPCIHLLRNSVIHGIEDPEERRRQGKPEEGVITIAARADGDLINIEFSDDGAGIDMQRVTRRALAMGLVESDALERMSSREKARLVFSSGLSTALQTTEMAGRGVGLDAVSTTIDRMGGTIRVETSRGLGTRFILQVPVSLSLTRVLLLEAGGQVLAIPNAAVVEVYRLAVKEIETVEGHEVTRYRGRLLPLVRLREALGLKGIKDIFVNKVGVVIMRAGEDHAGFVIDDFLGEREIVVRPFGPFLGRSFMVSGSTIMENGDVVIILHAPDLLRSVRERTGSSVRAQGATTSEGHERRILFVEDSVITREYVAGVLRGQGNYVAEASDGIEALELLDKESFDLVLTDLQMPRMDGFKLTAAIRKDPRIRHLPVIVLSTIETPETKRMALDAGADTYLVKSQFAADSLALAVQQVIR